MASQLSFVEYVCDQLSEFSSVRYQRMFGEYMIYVENKPVLMVCDDTLYIKRLPCLETLLKDQEAGCPYKGAKSSFILDADDKDLLQNAVHTALPFVKVPMKKLNKHDIRE